MFAAALDGFEELPEAQRIQFIAMTQSILRVWEGAFYQYRKKRLEERTWKAMLTQWTDFIAIDGVRKVWELRRHAYADDFRSFVDSLEGGAYHTR